MNNTMLLGALRQSPSLVDAIEASVARDPHRIAFRFVTYAEQRQHVEPWSVGALHHAAHALAVGLRSAGLSPGDRAVIFSDQSARDVISIVGCLYAGVLSVPIPPPVQAAKAERFRSVLATSGAKLVLGDAAYRGLLANDPPPVPVRTVAELSAKDAGLEAFHPATERLVYLQYTSGSTYAPKGVAVSQRNVLDSLALHDEFPESYADHRMVSWAPFFHNVGLMCLFMPLLVDLEGIVLRASDFMERPRRWFEVISQFRAQTTFGPNSAYNLAARAFGPQDLSGLDLSCLKQALNGSEPLDYRTLQDFAAQFAPAGFSIDAFVSTYGLAEATSGVTKTTRPIRPLWADSEALARGSLSEVAPTHPKAKRLVPVGGVSPRLDIAIVDPATGDRLADGRLGEIWVRGPIVAEGYWQDPRATDETFRASLPGAAGPWLRTGDVGALTGGDLYVTGRMKEVLIVNGHNLYPADLVDLVRRQVGPLRGEAMTCFSTMIDDKERVVCAIEHAGDELGALAAQVGEAIARVYEFSPYDVVFAAPLALPRADNGKLQTLKIRDAYASGSLPVRFSLRAAREHAAETEVEGPIGDLEAQVAALFQETLPGARIGRNDHFFALGGDSLAIARLAGRIKETVGVDVPIRFLLDQPTVRQIAKIIDDYRRNRSFEGVQITAAELRAECVLDPAIAPPPDERPRRSLEQAFLTGATGFLGAYLLRDLLQRTPAAVTCLVRARSPEHGWERVIENLSSYGLWDESFRERIRVVPGDLALPRLGLAEAEFSRLADEIDAVYHNGAYLNFVYPYRLLKDSNVQGTAECLRLACATRAKPFHHVSTYGVYDNPSHFGREVAEDDPLDDPSGYLLGYTESKWVAEKLVRVAARRGLRTTIYRPAAVSGASDSGIWRLEDAVIRSLVASLQVGALPDIGIRLHLTPVDYVSAALVTLSLREDSADQAFNLVNQDVVTIPELCRLLQDLGVGVQLTSFEEWRRRVFASPESALAPLETLFFEEREGAESMVARYSVHEPKFGVARALRGLEGSGVTCPPVDRRLLQTYLAALTSAAG